MPRNFVSCIHCRLQDILKISGHNADIFFLAHAHACGDSLVRKTIQQNLKTVMSFNYQILKNKGENNLLDDTIFNVDVQVFHAIIVDDATIFDQQAVLRALEQPKRCG